MPDPIVCDLSAIPADQREAHFELARTVLFADERHLAFALEIPPRNAALVLRVTGPGARDELRALLG